MSQGPTVVGVWALSVGSSAFLGVFLFLKPELAIHTRFRGSGRALVGQEKEYVGAVGEVGVCYLASSRRLPCRCFGIIAAVICEPRKIIPPQELLSLGVRLR